MRASSLQAVPLLLVSFQRIPFFIQTESLCLVQRVDQGKMVGQWLKNKAQVWGREKNWRVKGRVQMDGYGIQVVKQ